MRHRRFIERGIAKVADSAEQDSLRRLLAAFDADRLLLQAALAEVDPASPLAERVRQALESGDPLGRA